MLGGRKNGQFALVLTVAAVVGCESPELLPAVPEPPPAGLSVELTNVTAKTDVPNGRGWFLATVRFRNGGPDAVWILRPLDGSWDGRLMPHYRLTVTGSADPGDQVRRLCLNCGKWANTEWPR